MDGKKIIKILEISADIAPAVIALIEGIAGITGEGKVTLKEADEIAGRFPHPDEIERQVDQEDDNS